MTYICPNECDDPRPFNHEGKKYCSVCFHEGRGLIECRECKEDE